MILTVRRFASSTGLFSNVAWKIITVFFLSSLVAFSVGCTDAGKKEVSPSTDEKPPLRIGLVTWLGYGPFYIASEKGFFSDEGISVDLQRIEGDAERRAALASGKLNGIALTLDSMIVLLAQGVDVKTVMAIDTSNGGDGIVAVSEVKDIADLKGREIAFPTGLPSHFFLYYVLKQNGMGMDAIKPIVMDADKAGSAFVSGKVDVAVTWEPWLSKASMMEGGHILADSSKYPGVIEDVLFMSGDTIRTRPGDIKKLIKAWYRAVDYLKANPQESQRIMAEAFGLTEEEVKNLLPSVSIEGRERNRELFGTDGNPGYLYDLFAEIADAWVQEGVVEKKVTPDEGIYPDFVRELDGE